MEQITRVNHIGLRVSDFEVARNFYVKLGFKCITRPGGPEPVAIIEHPSGINFNLILNANQTNNTNILMDVAKKYTGYTHVAIEITDANAVLAQLAEQDIALSGGPMDHPTGTSFFIRDPDNNVVEFIEYTGLSAFK